MLEPRKSLLHAGSAIVLRSLDELFALADAMEREAAEKYEELAGEMERQGRPDLATVFTQLAKAERGHVDNVARWSRAHSGHDPDPALVRWEQPGTFDPNTEAEIRSSRLMRPYRALSMAVRNEERAFAFWSYAAAFAKDAAIRQAAESMAREELEHVATLRRERRRAYHQERGAGSLPGMPKRQLDAGALERRLARQLSELANSLGEIGATRANALAVESRQMAEQAIGIGHFAPDMEQQDAETLGEALAEAYLEGADATDDPAHLLVLQKLGQQAIARLAWLRALKSA